MAIQCSLLLVTTYGPGTSGLNREVVVVGTVEWP